MLLELDSNLNISLFHHIKFDSLLNMSKNRKEEKKRWDSVVSILKFTG